MSHLVRPAIQVIEYARRLAPEPRRAVKQALAALRNEIGDLKALEGNLAGCYRLRVGRHRIIFAYAGKRMIAAIFIEERSIVYEIFEAQFVKRFRA
jgi:mRNA interferase RelE/StbE